MPKYKSGEWDGYISLMNGMRIPTGMLRYVEEGLREGGYLCKYYGVAVNRRTPTAEAMRLVRAGTILEGVVLRDYQHDAVLTLLEKQRGIADMATNAGKTVVFAALIKALGNTDALVVVNTKDLLHQTSTRLQEYLGRRVGIIGDGKRSDSDVCVATIQSLNAMRKSLKARKFKARFAHNSILVIDECHHVSNNRTLEVLMDIPGWHRYGVSGTPLERDALSDLSLIGCTGPVQVHVSNQQLIQEKWSAQPIIQINDMAYLYDWQDDDDKRKYHHIYEEAIAGNEARNAWIAQLAVEECVHGPTLVVVTRLAQGKALLDEMQVDGSEGNMFVHGGSSMEERTLALRRMARGDKFVCIATQIFDEGVDVPALDTIILAAGGKSRMKLLQRIGRGLRKKKDDAVLYVHDFYDGGQKYLQRHYRERMAEYERQGFTVEHVPGKDFAP
jgi:superfamily II DNA or RNA helicase